MNEIRNILLIGRTGSGKSTLGNVLINQNNNFEEVFKESDGSVSATKEIKEKIVEIDLTRDGSEKRKYRIIDTIGIGDTKLTPQGVLTRLAEIGSRVKREGLNHILFVTQGRFTKEEVEEVLENPTDADVSRSSGRPVVFGETSTGRHLMVVYEEIDPDTVYPVTAYDVPRRRRP